MPKCRAIGVLSYENPSSRVFLKPKQDVPKLFKKPKQDRSFCKNILQYEYTISPDETK